MVSLALEKLLHKRILSSAIPQTQHQIAKEPNARFGHIHCEGDPISVTSQVVRKNDGSHGGFTSTHFAHK